MAWVLIPALLHHWLDMAWIYFLRMVMVTILLWSFRKCYLSIFSGRSRLQSILMGILLGITGCILWVILLTPFISENTRPWDPLPFFLRAISATLLVPVFEELLMRGYIFKLASQWDLFKKRKKENALALTLDHATVNDGHPPQWSMSGVLISTFFFTMGHAVHEWPAALAYGLLMAFLLIKTGGLLACVVGHATTNLTLAMYVWFTGQWGFW